MIYDKINKTNTILKSRRIDMFCKNCGRELDPSEKFCTDYHPYINKLVKNTLDRLSDR